MAASQAARLVVTAPGRCSLSGELGFASVPQLWPQGAPMFKGQSALEIDLGAVERADSAGLALLVAWRGQAQAAGCALRYVSVPQRLLAIARISDADSFLAG
jgi:phospholipid transport system transporter-binding protein